MSRYPLENPIETLPYWVFMTPTTTPKIPDKVGNSFWVECWPDGKVNLLSLFYVENLHAYQRVESTGAHMEGIQLKFFF